MGSYMNPAALLQDNIFSRHVTAVGNTPQERYAEFMKQVPTNSLLVAHCDRGIFTFVIDVSCYEEFMEFYKQYQQGLLLSFDVYVVTKNYFLDNKQ